MQFPLRKEIDRLGDEIKIEQDSISIIVALKKVELKKGNTKLRFAYDEGVATLSGDMSDKYKKGQIVKLTWHNGDESGKPVISILRDPA